jgi:hypothetical protein
MSSVVAGGADSRVASADEDDARPQMRRYQI